MEKNCVFYFWLILLKKHQFIYGLPENKRYTYYYHVYVITQAETFQIVIKKNVNQDIYTTLIISAKFIVLPTG